MRRGPFFFFFFFFFTFIFIFPSPPPFKTTEICFEVYQNGNFLKKCFTSGKKNEEKWLCPFWKIFLLRPWAQELFLNFHMILCLFFFIFSPYIIFFEFVTNKCQKYDFLCDFFLNSYDRLDIPQDITARLYLIILNLCQLCKTSKTLSKYEVYQEPLTQH